jgi:transposase
MARGPRIDTTRLDLDGFEAWLRGQLSGSAFAAVVLVIMQILRALFAQNTQLRVRLLGGRAKPPSERLSAVRKQLAFGFAVPANDVTPTPAAKPQDTEQKQRTRKAHHGGRKRTPLPAHIAVVEIPNNVPADQCVCPACAVRMTDMKPRATDTIELVPGYIVVNRRLDQRLACPKCDRIVSAKAPAGILDGGLLGPTLVIEALGNKILDGAPIERQARHFQRQGVPLSASTLGRSVSSLLALLSPLSRCIQSKVKRSERLQLDSTGLRVLDAEAVTGVHRDTLWVVIGDRKWVHFAALRDGDSDSFEELMRGTDAEVFQCDGTSTTNFVEKRWKRCRPGCHAHARRKLVEAARRGDLRAMVPLQLYTRLFAIERDAARRGLDAEARRELRERESVPVLDALRDWVLRHAAEVEPASALGKALTYLQRQWLRLSLFVLDGEIELTNNRSERELRAWVLGQHAWLFVGDQVNADRWAAGFSIVHTALAHGINPRAYLHAVVKAILAGHPHNRLDELLPDAMLAAHPELADTARAASRMLEAA